MALIAFLLVQPVVYSQLTVGIGTQYHCEQTEILLPVLVSDFENVVSISLYFEIDTTELQYETLVNHNAMLDGGFLLDSFSDTNGNFVISVTWSRLTPVVIASGKLFDLKLYYKGGSPLVNFSSDCEIALADLSIVENVIYQDGVVLPLKILSQPQNITAVEKDTIEFSVTDQGATAFQWQRSSGSGWSNLSDTQGITGSDTNQLIINTVPLDFDQHLFRCVVTLDDCYVTSDSAILLVSPLGISSSYYKSSLINAYPNPFNEKLNFVVNASTKDASAQLVNLMGKTVYQSSGADLNQGSVQTIYTGDLRPGFYFLQLKRENGLFSTVKVLKQ